MKGCKVYRWPKNANKKPTFAISLEKFDKIHIHKKKETSMRRKLNKGEENKGSKGKTTKRTVMYDTRAQSTLIKRVAHRFSYIFFFLASL